MRAALTWLVVMLAATAASAQCVVFPMSAADKAYALSQSTFLDPDYVNNQPAPCVLHGQQADTPPTWTVAFLASTDATVTAYKLLLYPATSGYWQSDVAANEAPTISINVGKPTPDATGTVTITTAPALPLNTTYRMAVVLVHADGTQSAPSAYTDPFDDVPCFCTPVNAPRPGAPTLLVIRVN